MTTTPDDNRFAPPRAEVADLPPSDGSPVLAGRGKRLLGGIIDVVIVLASLGLVAWVTPWNPFASRKPFGFNPLESIMGFVLFVLVQGYPLIQYGQTWGKRMLGMRIVRTDGSRVDPLRLIGLRYGIGSLFGLVPAVAQIWALVDSLAIFRASRQCLHDSVADTIVIQT